MSKFIENVNYYISQRKIKQNYISMKTGIDVKKLSRILTGAQDVNSADMERIAQALGQKTEFFLAEALQLPDMEGDEAIKIAFYAGEPTKKQEQTVENIIRFLETIDFIWSAKNRFLHMAEE